MMKVSQKLVGHCIYLNIMRVTTSSEVLDKFITDGGWRLMNKWLSEAKETDNNPIVMEILKVGVDSGCFCPLLLHNIVPMDSE